MGKMENKSPQPPQKPATDGKETGTGTPPDPPPGFPKKVLEQLEKTVLPSENWVIPVQKGGELEICMRELLRMFREKRSDDQVVVRFATSSLPVSYEKMLSDTAVEGWNDDIQRNVYELMILFLEIACEILDPESAVITSPLVASLFSVLALIFDPSVMFHMRNMRKQPMFKPDPENVFSVPRTGETAYGWLADFLNIFGARGGFDKLLAFANAQPKEGSGGNGQLSAALAVAVIRPSSACARAVTPRVLETYVLPISRIVTEYFTKLDGDQLRKESLDLARNESLFTAIRALRSLRMMQVSFVEASGEYDSLLLTVLLRLLKGKSFNGCMYALNEIKRLITETFTGTKKDAVVWLTGARLAKWMVDNNILQIVFTDHLHQSQYVSKLESILRFLINEKHLTTQDLTMVWSCQSGKHEAIVNNVLSLLTQLAYYCDTVHLDHLFDCVKESWSMNANEKDRMRLLSFLAKLAEDDSEGKMATKVLDLLWSLAHQEDTPMPIAQAALDAHVRILSNGYIREKEAVREQWIVQSVEDLKQRKWILPALRHIRAVSDLFPDHQVRTVTTGTSTMVPRFRTRQVMLKGLDERVGVTALIVNTLVEYCELARKTFETLGEDVKKDDFVVMGKFPHHQTIDEILQFVRFLSWDLRLYLATEDACKMWDAVVVGAPTANDRVTALDWFRAAAEPEISLLNESSIRVLFTDRIQQMSVAQMTLEAYLCFEQYFIQLNTAAGNITKAAYLSFNTYALVGVETVWSIALESPVEEIAARALKMIQQMNIAISPQLKAANPNFHDKFLSDCMPHLTDAYFHLTRNPPSREEERQVLIRKVVRCLSLIEDYTVVFDQTYQRQRLFPPHGVSYKAEDIILVCHAPDMREPEFSLTFHGNSCLRQVRRAIATRFGVEPSQLALSTSDKPLLPEHDNRPLRFFGIRSGCNISVTHENHDSGAGNYLPLPSNPEMESAIPSLILSRRPDFMAKFHELAIFPLSQEIQQRARSLLNALPSDPEARRALQQGIVTAVSNPDEASRFVLSFLQPEHVFPALYRAQLLLSLITPNDVFASNPDDVSEFHAGLQAIEICKLIITILGKVKFAPQSPLDKQDTCLLLRIYCIMIRQSIVAGVTEAVKARAAGSELRPSLPRGVQTEELSALLLRLIWTAGTGRALSPGEPQKMDVDVPEAEAAAAGPKPSPTGMSPDEVSLALDAVAALHPCLQFSQPFRDHFLTQEGVEDMLRDLLLASPFETIRASLPARFTKVLHNQKLLVDLLELVLRLRPHVDTYKSTCAEYFDFICTLVSTAYNKAQPDARVLELLESESLWLANPPPAHERSEPLLAGHLRFCSVLVGICAERRLAVGELLLEKLFHKYLFPASTLLKAVRERDVEQVIDGTEPVCTSAVSRVPAFLLLTSLATGCIENLQYVVETIRALHFAKEEEPIEEWEFYPQISPKSQAGQLGLKNAGATCYMNAVMQQLYMQPDIRNAILSVGDIKDENLVENILYQMQIAFAHMQFGQMQYYTPEGLWKSYRHWGEPINVREQQDAAEFFNGIVDQIDEKLKAAGQPQVLSKIFGGLFADQKIVKSGCDHTYEREEPFTTLGIAVHGYSNLQESLNNYIKGDLLEGANAYKCEKCNGEKRDAVKRMCIKTLPRVLVMHLSRFQYDYEKDQPVKFNDQFEFPRDIDMGPYTAAGLTALESQTGEPVPKFPYRLSGVVVHSGQANGGHYYSFVRVRDGEDNAGKKWLKFDDTDVSFASVENENAVRNEWFGGEYTSDVWDPQFKKYISKTRERWWNGYLLFYERVEDGDTSSANTTFSVPQPLGGPSPLIFRKVQEENLRFAHHRYLFSADYFEFFKNLATANATWLASMQGPFNDQEAHMRDIVGLSCAQLSFDFLVKYGFRIHRSIRGSLMEWPNIFSHLVSSCPHARTWLLTKFLEDEKIHLAHLVQCTNVEVRTVYEKILLNSILYTFNQDGLAHGLQMADKIFDLILPFMKKELRANWKLFGQYFAFIYDYALLGAEMRAHLQQRDILHALFNFLFVDFNWSKCHSVDFTNIHATISLLVRSMNLSFLEEREQVPLQLSNPYHDLSCNPLARSSPKPLLQPPEDLRDLLFGEQFNYFSVVLSQSPSSLFVSQLVQCSVWRSSYASSKLIAEILYKLSTVPVDHMKPYFDLLFSILSVEDNLQPLRIPYALRGNQRASSLFAEMNHQKARSPRRTYFFIKFICRLLKELETASRWLLSDDVLPSWSWICRWLDDELRPVVNGDVNERGVSNEIPSNRVYLERSESALNLLEHLQTTVPVDDLEDGSEEEAAERMDEESANFSSQSDEENQTSG